MLMDFAISNKNYNIIKYALENIRVNEDDTQFVKMNVIITAINNDDVDILTNLLKVIKFEDVVIYDFLADKAKQNNKLEYEKIIKESI
jgi:calcineurin-like phosphoesterase family protein